MTEICNMVMDEGKIPRDWGLGTLQPIYTKGRMSHWSVRLIGQQRC